MKIPVDRLVLPIDFSDPSMSVLDAISELVGSPEGLHLMYVINDLTDLNPALVLTPDGEERAERARSALRRHAAEHGLEGCHVSVSHSIGNPAPAIVEYAEAVEADLIAIAASGRTGLSRVLLGSVAERVVRFAKCPVLVIRKPQSLSAPPDDIP